MARPEEEDIEKPLEAVCVCVVFFSFSRGFSIEEWECTALYL